MCDCNINIETLSTMDAAEVGRMIAHDQNRDEE